MKYLKNFFFTFLISICFFLLTLFLFTLLNYFNIIGIRFMNTCKVIIPLLSIGIGGFLLGKKASKRGYLEGVKFGIFVILIIFLCNLFASSVNYKDFIFYLLLIICSIFGSMLGINCKKEV